MAGTFDNSAGVANARGPDSHRRPAIDAARGVAMLFACLSHAVESQASFRGWTPPLQLLRMLSMVASPSFMLISGMTLGLAATGGTQRFVRFREKVLERGVLLLTAGHLLILLAVFPIQGVRVLLVTDTIAFALIVGPPIVVRTANRRRLRLAVALLTLSWLIILLVPDGTGGAATIVKQTLFGFRRYQWWTYSFPLVPWLAVYLIGTVIGERLAQSPSDAASARWLLVRGVGAVALSLVTVVVGSLLRRVTPATAQVHETVGQLAAPWRKVPPSPAYLLLYGGAALIMTSIVFGFEAADLVPWLRDRAAEVGRASLVIFVAQFYLFYLFMPVLLGGSSPYWPLYFAGGIVLLSVGARAWLVRGGNDLLRLPGFDRVRRRLNASRAYPAAP